MHADPARPAWSPLRAAGWALACGLVTTGELLVLHGLSIRDRPGLPPVLPDHPTRVDAYGDPLPVGAVARLGSKRFRIGAGGNAAVLARGGSRLVAVLPDQRIGVFDVVTGRRVATLTGERRWVPWRRPGAGWSLRVFDVWNDETRVLAWTRFEVGELRRSDDGRSVLRDDPFAPDHTAPRSFRIDVATARERAERAERGTRSTPSSATFEDVLTERRPDSDLWRIRQNPSPGGRYLARLTWSATDGPDASGTDPSAGQFFTSLSDAERGRTESLLESATSSRPEPAWDEDERFWLLTDDAVLVYEPGDVTPTVRAAAPTRAQPRVPVWVVPELEALVVEERAERLPPPLAARWKTPDNLANDLDAMNAQDTFLPRATGSTGTPRLLLSDRDGRGAAITAIGEHGNFLTWRFESATTVLGPSRDHRARIDRIAWHPDGRRLAAVDADGVVILWDAATGTALWTARIAGFTRESVLPEGLGWFASSMRLAFGPGGATLEARRPPPEQRDSPSGSGREPTSWHWHVEDGSVAGSSEIGGSVPPRVEEPDVEALEVRLVFDPSVDQLNLAKLTGGSRSTLPVPRLVGRSTAAGQFDPDVWFVPVDTERSAETIGNFDALFFGLHHLRVARSPGHHVAVVYRSNVRARLVDLRNGALLFTFPTDEGLVASVCWSPDGRQLATGGIDGSLLVWDVDEMIRHGR